MAHTEPCILTNMCMITDGSRVLVQDRLNPNWPGITFPGGHVEPGESFVDSVIREIREETGLAIANVQLCGVKQFTVKNGAYRYIVFLYKTSTFSGELCSSEEGRVFWVEQETLRSLNLAEDFDTMLNIFESDSLTENYHWHDGSSWQYANK